MDAEACYEPSLLDTGDRQFGAYLMGERRLVCVATASAQVSARGTILLLKSA